MGTPAILGLSRALVAIGEWFDVFVDQIHDASHLVSIRLWHQDSFFPCNAIVRVNASSFQCQVPNVFSDQATQSASVGVQVTNIYNVANVRPFPTIQVARTTESQGSAIINVGGSV